MYNNYFACSSIFFLFILSWIFKQKKVIETIFITNPKLILSCFWNLRWYGSHTFPSLEPSLRYRLWLMVR